MVKYMKKFVWVIVLLMFSAIFSVSCGKDQKSPTESSPSAFQRKIPGSITFVSIPAGSFLMGSDDGPEDEKPVHSVSLDAFEMSATKITNEQYCAYLNEALASGDITATTNSVTGSGGEYSGKVYIKLSGVFDSRNKCWIQYSNSAFSVKPGKENWPVVYVTWYGCSSFAEYYSLDLPIEAEWEYAARGGMQYRYGTDDGTIDSSKSNYNLDVWYPTDVGTFPANPFGLYDMSGNVWEWCNDWYDSEYYARSPEQNPPGAQSGTERVLRGGSWANSTGGCRAANRNSRIPDFSGSGAGFRVVRHFHK